MENNNQEPRRNDLSRYYAWYEGQEKGTPKVGVVSSTAGRIRQSQFMDNTGGIITEQDYGRRLENRLRGNLDNLFTARQDAEQIRSFISPSIRREFDLINAGFTTSRSLGKEHDKELNRITLRRMIDGGYQNSEVLEDERRWAAYAANDADMTVQDLVSSLTAERIASDNRIIDTLKTEEELTNAGYQLSSFAVPVLEANKGKLYDLTYATKRPITVEKVDENGQTTHSKQLTQIPAYALASNGNEITIDSFANMRQIENAEEVLYSLAKSLGVKLVKDNSLSAGETSFKERRLRSFGRRVLNGFRIRTNAKSTSIQKSGVLRYSDNGNSATTVYTVVKALSELACANAVDRTTKLISEKSPSNLPNLNTFNSKSALLLDVSGSLIASDLVLMSKLNDNDAKIFRSLFRLDAAQKLSSIQDPQNSNWVVPVVSSYYLNGTQHFANDLRVDVANFATKLGTQTARQSFNGAVMGQCDWQKKANDSLINDFEIQPINFDSIQEKTNEQPKDEYEEIDGILKSIAENLQDNGAMSEDDAREKYDRRRTKRERNNNKPPKEDEEDDEIKYEILPEETAEEIEKNLMQLAKILQEQPAQERKKRKIIQHEEKDYEIANRLMHIAKVIQEQTAGQEFPRKRTEKIHEEKDYEYAKRLRKIAENIEKELGGQTFPRKRTIIQHEEKDYEIASALRRIASNIQKETAGQEFPRKRTEKVHEEKDYEFANRLRKIAGEIEEENKGVTYPRQRIIKSHEEKDYEFANRMRKIGANVQESVKGQEFPRQRTEKVHEEKDYEMQRRLQKLADTIQEENAGKPLPKRVKKIRDSRLYTDEDIHYEQLSTDTEEQISDLISGIAKELQKDATPKFKKEIILKKMQDTLSTEASNLDSKIKTLQKEINGLKTEQAIQDRKDKIAKLEHRQDTVNGLNERIKSIINKGREALENDLAQINQVIENGDNITKEVLQTKNQIIAVLTMDTFAENEAKNISAMGEILNKQNNSNLTASQINREYILKTVPTKEGEKAPYEIVEQIRLTKSGAVAKRKYTLQETGAVDPVLVPDDEKKNTSKLLSKKQRIYRARLDSLVDSQVSVVDNKNQRQM